ncbi:GNAT family N-acyltransferase [Paremcibacter congregatus]|uniref:GNAT family N-acyltransferase n=1 Tax=Paremcibacter congregatus TaxID=2043170 RepID=UPI0030ECB99A
MTSALRYEMALTPEQIDACYHLRHRVYAEERPWEPTDLAELEKDAYDRKSAHVLVLWHSHPIATARLCLGPRLPLQKYLPEYELPEGAMEIGRLCIPSPKVEQIFRRVEVIKCLAEGFETLRQYYGDRNVLTLMRPALTRVLNRAGYTYEKLGPSVDSDGMRWLMKYRNTSVLK